MMETGTPKGQAPCFNVGDNSTVYEEPTPPPGTHTEANLFAVFSPHSYPASLTPRRILPENISVNHMYPIPISGFALAFPPAAAQCTTRAFPGLTVSSSTSHPFHPAPPQPLLHPQLSPHCFLTSLLPPSMEVDSPHSHGFQDLTRDLLYPTTWTPSCLFVST